MEIKKSKSSKVCNTIINSERFLFSPRRFVLLFSYEQMCVKWISCLTMCKLILLLFYVKTLLFTLIICIQEMFPFRYKRSSSGAQRNRELFAG